MSIVRAARKSNFYMLPASVIEDRRLSWHGRGMLIYLLSKPDNWRVQIKDLINQTKEALGGRSGRDKVYKGLNELRAAGYLYQEFIREGGNFRGVEYEVSEVPDLEQAAIYVASLQAKAASKGTTAGDQPFPDLPETVAPHTESTVTASPFPGNPEAIDSTESSLQIEKAVMYDDPGQAGESVDQVAAVAEKSKGHRPAAGEPEDYPKCQSSTSYAPWHAYARAYRAKHKAWPVCNKHMLSQMCQLVARVGDLAAVVATYYVKHETAKYLVDALHPVGALLKNCESYATRAQQCQRVQNARQHAEQKVQTLAAAPAADVTAQNAPPAAVTNDKGAGIGLSALMTLAAARAPAKYDQEAHDPVAAKPKVVPAGLAQLIAARPGPQPVRIAL